MKFTKEDRKKPAEYEKEIVTYWKKNKTFEKSIENRPKEDSWVFYDGPPFLTGTPHHGHLLISAVKDTVARYQTMKGKHVERRWGWDCHGLPAEVFVEKQLGITNKKDIGVKISIPDYVKACRAAMVQTGTEWEDTIDRIGRWVEFKGAYKTMDNEYMESVWWAFKTLYEKGKVYEGEKILVYCTKDATPISKSEVAMENSYQVDTDPSVYVYFKLEESDEHVLAWTTTPWTLPANVAIAVNEKLEYTLVEYEGKKVYVATGALERVFKDEKKQPLEYKVLSTLSGKKLVGKRYHPLFESHGPDAHRVLPADFVTEEDGTGIVHEAPAYGEEDYELCKREGVPIVSMVDENGAYTSGRWQEQNIWEVNKEIAKTLVAEGNAMKVEYIQHDYPHCHRCGTKLMYRAHPSWFMDIQDQKQEMLKANSQTSWTPQTLRDGRFANIIDSAPDWNLSRDRYWATPLPVWKGQRPDGTEVIKVIGSYEEFKTLTGLTLDDYHLPNVMDTTFTVDGVELKHIGKVIDCWFESGSMPFAQFHYPFENVQKFEESFPADFIIEAIDQTRGWFYSLTAVNVGLFGKSPFKNLICTGFINAADGKKMSKKLKNYTDPNELMDAHGADSFRFLLMGSPLLNGEDFALKDKEVLDVQRKLAMVWNMYDFFTLYAEVDGWEYVPSNTDTLKEATNVLDKWIISRVHQLSAEVDVHMNNYDIPNATKPILPFIDDASNWFVRRSRKRFWKSDNDGDKQDAYKTLHYVLVELSKIMAPFTPFMSEALYRNLTGEESVHLTDWSNNTDVDMSAIDKMAITRKIIEQGLSLRMVKTDTEDQVKVRQPLALLTYNGDKLDVAYEEMIAEEVNVKQVVHAKTAKEEVVLDKTLTDELRAEGNAREVVRLVQSARKKAGLNVDDRIQLHIASPDKNITNALVVHKEYIAKETLATITEVTEPMYQENAAIGGEELSISISK